MIVESFEDVIHLSGALQSNFWDTVHTAISLTLKRHPSGVIIDCSGITSCTPEGAETFQDIQIYIQEHEARVICVGVPDNVMEVLKATPEVRSQLPLAASVEEARHSLDLLVTTLEKKKRSAPTEELPRIVLYVTGDARDIQGLEAGKRMALGTGSEIVLAHVIVVPRELPIQSPLAKEEEQALAALKAAQTFMAARHVPHKIILERGREIATTLEAILDEQKGSTLLVPLSTDPAFADSDLKLIKSALAKVTATVAFIRDSLRTQS